eukprot:GHVL01037872.1.p1 GENE.GHVL01037872.1~~GHVL01037872.1.p1  ORF type:complete len:166 (+),score=25.61 GHVL01037872.1:34-531(+)
MKTSKIRFGGNVDILQIIYPGYKDKFFQKLPDSMKKIMIKKSLNVHNEFAKESKGVASYMRVVRPAAELIAPPYRWRRPLVDIFRQKARGTFLVGRPWKYIPHVDRLNNVYHPFTKEEMAERNKHRSYSLKGAIVLAFFMWLSFKICVYDPRVTLCQDQPDQEDE